MTVPQLRIGPLTVHWSDKGLLVSTPTGQYQLSAKDTFELLLYLTHLQESIMYGDVPEWTPAIGPNDASEDLPPLPRGG